MNQINRPLPGQPPLPSPPSDQSCSNYDNNNRDNRSKALHAMESSKYDLKGAVRLPPREDKKEWVAYNLFDFHKQVCMLFGTISVHCTRDKCPDMTAGQNKYLWDSDRISVDVCAYDYIARSLDWIEEQLSNENIFPTESTMDKYFPQNFVTICEQIARRLFRVFAHVYHHHLTHVRNAKIEAHMNTSLKHFIYFVKEFDLISAKELEPLKDYVDKLDIMDIGNLKITN